MLTAGVDIGGTKVFAALVDEKGSIREKVSQPTDAEEGTGSILRTLEDLLGRVAPERQPSSIGIAAAGLVDHLSGHLVLAPNLVYGEPELGRVAEEHFGCKVIVENDANAAAWAEYEFGAARGYGDMLMLTIGTGIGGGVIIDGRLVRGHRGFAAEFGHITLVEGGPRCACGEWGCLEALASGSAIGRMAREEVDAAHGSILPELVDGRTDRITGALVSEAARAGDAFSCAVLERAGRWLGVGLANLVRAFDPAVIVIGGGGAAAGSFLLDPARLELGRRLGSCGGIPPVVEAVLGNDAGAIGAASLARARFSG